jgi:hypothetical protein
MSHDSYDIRFSYYTPPKTLVHSYAFTVGFPFHVIHNAALFLSSLFMFVECFGYRRSCFKVTSLIYVLSRHKSIWLPVVCRYQIGRPHGHGLEKAYGVSCLQLSSLELRHDLRSHIQANAMGVHIVEHIQKYKLAITSQLSCAIRGKDLKRLLSALDLISHLSSSSAILIHLQLCVTMTNALSRALTNDQQPPPYIYILIARPC